MTIAIGDIVIVNLGAGVTCPAIITDATPGNMSGMAFNNGGVGPIAGIALAGDPLNPKALECAPHITAATGVPAQPLP